MTSDRERAERLSRELEAAFRNRADLYRLMLDELRRSLEPSEAEDLMERIIERRGREVGTAAFGAFGPNDALALGEAFVTISPDGGRMYPTKVDRFQDGIEFRVSRCPLKDAWIDSKVSDEELATLCRLAGAFDRGLFESCGVRFENTTWTSTHGSDCCHIRLSNRDASDGNTGRALMDGE